MAFLGENVKLKIKIFKVFALHRINPILKCKIKDYPIAIIKLSLNYQSRRSDTSYLSRKKIKLHIFDRLSWLRCVLIRIAFIAFRIITLRYSSTRYLNFSQSNERKNILPTKSDVLYLYVWSEKKYKDKIFR